MGELIAAFAMLFAPVGPCDALEALDVVRERAWSTGDVALLAGLYQGRAGAADVASLTAWDARGVTVQGARVVRASCRPTREGVDVVEVVERLGPMVAVLPDGSRRALPADGWDRRTVALVHAGRWRIATVHPSVIETRTPRTPSAIE